MTGVALDATSAEMAVGFRLTGRALEGPEAARLLNLRCAPELEGLNAAFELPAPRTVVSTFFGNFWSSAVGLRRRP